VDTAGAAGAPGEVARPAGRAGVAVADHVEATPAVDLVMPAHNEAEGLARSVRQVVARVPECVACPTRITIVDNASTDATWQVAQQLARDLPGVRAVRLEGKGRGRALHHVWSTSDAPVVAYMDADLSTDLAALGPLLAPLVSGHSDVAVGTRHAPTARVERGPKRAVLSRSYNLLLRVLLGARFSDAQCGFKAMRTDAAELLLPHVEDTGWFFDTELLVLAERAGLRLHEVPVDWVDDGDSSVDLLATAAGDLRGVGRILAGLVTGRIPVASMRDAVARRRPPVTAAGPLFVEMVRFGLVGVASTVVHAALFVGLREVWAAQAANATALLTAAVGNTAANRHWTFGASGGGHVARHYIQALVVLATALALTSGALAVLHTLAPTPSRALEVVVLVAAAGSATLLRFVALRRWVFRVSDRRDA
jgi:putative flippase GtrA